MRRLHKVLVTLPALALCSYAASLGAPRASAMDMWCWEDPMVQVNNTLAAINVGVAGSTGDVTDTIKGVTITVYVPNLDRAKVVKTQNGALNETVRFVPADDDDRAGEVNVDFELQSKKAPRNAAVQVTANGKTSTVIGKTRKGIKVFFTVK